MATTHVSSASELKTALASAKGGDTILLKSGNYGWVSLENFRFNDYVTIKSADGDGGAVFKHIGLNKTSHIRLDSLTAEFGATTPALQHLKAIEVRKSDHLQLVNTEVTGHAGTKDWNDVPRGIQIWDGSSDVQLIGNHFHHFEKAVAILGTENVTLKDNLVDHIHSDGFFFQNSSKILIENNLLTDFYRSGTVHADYIQFDAGKGTPSHDVTIRGNVMLQGKGNGDVQGIFGDAGDYYSIHKSTFKNFLIENNIYSDTGINGLHFWSGENMTLRNNTVLMDPSTTHPNSPSRILMRGPQINSVIENNVALQVAAEGGSTASGNVIVQFNDPSKANYYGKLFANAFADPATLADLAPKSGTPIVYGSGKGAEKLFQELLSDGGSDTATVTVNVGAASAVGAAINASSADQNFSGGNTYKTSAAIANTTEDALYQSERYGNFDYAIDVADGTYNVTLQFAEIYWDAAGKRVFDVAAEGKLILDNLDIFSAAGGKNIAYDVTVPVAVNDGALNLQFITVADNAKISAIRIEGVGDGDGTNAELHADSGFVTDPLLV